MFRTSKPTDIKFLVPAGMRVVMIFLSWIVGAVIMLLVSAILSKVLSGNQQAFLRISTVCQDMLMWILPAILTAMVITRQPARFLAIDAMPDGRLTLISILLLIVSAPLMSWIVKLNAQFHFPESMGIIEQTLRAMEDNATHITYTMMGSNTAGNLIMNILIIGIFAGFAEEIFFRGALQRVLSTSRMNAHAAIWVSAAIFSLLHFQFFGFLPRLLLGATFGYLLMWSGSLWLPILIHTLNNTFFIVLYSVTGSGEPEFSSAAGQTPWVTIIISGVFTALCFAALKRYSRKISENNPK